MKRLLTSDVYQIRGSYNLDDISYKTLLQLYQPLMGMEATSLYLTLYSELDQITLTKSPSLISRLCKITGFSLSALVQAFDKLEAMSLISTYVKKQNDNRFLFDLKLPLTPQEFMSHRILNTLLKQRLKDEYEKTISCFQVYNVNLDDYQEISASFTDIYDISFDDYVLREKNYKEKVVNGLEDEYDLELFFNGLDQLQLSKKMFNHEDKKLIKQMGVLYRINALDMQTIVKTSMTDSKLNYQLFSKNCRKYYDIKVPEKFENIFHKQSPLLHQEEGNSALDKHIHYLENISPYDLLKDKNGGSEPLKRDLQAIEAILTSLQLEPGVVNVLIETTLQKCNQSLPKNFMEALGGQWKRKKIKTVKEAMEEGKAYLKYQSNNNLDWDDYSKDIQIKTIDNNDDKVDADALAILQQFD